MDLERRRFPELAAVLTATGCPGAPYFRTLPRFETAAPKCAFLNKLLAVGNGVITREGPVHVIEEIL